MSRYSDSSLMSGLGARRHRRRRIGRGVLSSLIEAVGLGRKRRRRRAGARRVRRHRRGRGIFDTIKNAFSSALPFIKKSGIVGHLAGMIPGVGGIASAGAKALGFGRRRRVRRHRRMGGAVRRRRTHRRGRGILL